MTPSRAYIPKAKASNWRTPPVVLDAVRELWPEGIGLDPCASPDPAHHFATVNYTEADDGLAKLWWGRAYVNPRFDQLARWAEKCAEEHEKHGAEVVLLLPARTDTRYWHEYVAQADAICFWRGRLTFVGAASVAPFPVALVYFGSRPWEFHRVFRAHGLVVAP